MHLVEDVGFTGYSKKIILKKKQVDFIGIFCVHLYQDEKGWFYCPKLSEKKLDSRNSPNFQIITLAGVKCETVPRPMKLGGVHKLRISFPSFQLPSRLFCHFSLLLLFNC